MLDDKDVVVASAGKFSRYRSVRHAAAKEQAGQPPLPVKEPVKGAGRQDQDASTMGRTKSMARYRKSRVGDHVAVPPPLPSIPSMPPQTQQDALQALEGIVPIRTTRRVTEHAPLQDHQSAAGAPQASKGRETEDERMRRKVLEFREREAQKERIEGEKRIARLKAEEETRIKQQRIAQAGAEARRLQLEEEETARILAEQKRKDLERLEATLDAAVPTTPGIMSPRDKFGFFSRNRAASKAGVGSGGNSRGTSLIKSRSAEQKTEKTSRNASPPSRRVAKDPVLMKPDPTHVIEQGGGGIVPQTDAPISASNAGERRVLVRCKQSSINLPITPETTPVDLIFSAANVMTQNINLSTAVLVESYAQLGLERRIRRYEHIRDIMNSWDRDTQNSFTLVNSDSPLFDKNLEVSSASKEPAASMTVYMYHSQRPGKWNKRYITLLPTGQICMSKKSGGNTADKDTMNLCHLSDFDIYTSTPQQTRKNLKPPKKHCYAIKSQQKTTMFLDTGNFVHYFSTDDEELANQWYAAVQGWRSWYLVNKKGEGQTKKMKTAVIKKTRTHAVKVSVDENPYTIGTFAPLLDMDRFDKPEREPSDRGYDSENSQPHQIPFHLRNGVSPIPSRRESKRHPPPVSYKLTPEAEEEFSSGGLLGRMYSQRQRKQQETMSAQSSGFIDGPSLLNNGPVSRDRAMSIRSTHAPNTKRPETSAGPPSGMPKPLLDFTPQFKEAPQWDKTGKGHGVRPISGVPLVDVATTPEDAARALAMGATPVLFRRNQSTAARPMTARARMGKGEAVFKGGLGGRGRYD